MQFVNLLIGMQVNGDFGYVGNVNLGVMVLFGMVDFGLNMLCYNFNGLGGYLLLGGLIGMIDFFSVMYLSGVGCLGQGVVVMLFIDGVNVIVLGGRLVGIGYSYVDEVV